MNVDIIASDFHEAVVYVREAASKQPQFAERWCSIAETETSRCLFAN